MSETCEFNTTNPVARKEHRCFGCAGVIAKGEKHFHYTGKFQGDFCSTRFHEDCYEKAMEPDSPWFDDWGADEGFLAECGMLPEGRL